MAFNPDKFRGKDNKFDGIKGFGLDQSIKQTATNKMIL